MRARMMMRRRGNGKRSSHVWCTGSDDSVARSTLVRASLFQSEQQHKFPARRVAAAPSMRCSLVLRAAEGPDHPPAAVLGKPPRGRDRCTRLAQPGGPKIGLAKTGVGGQLGSSVFAF
ncbi:unnamed protein product [Prorocentrum cordatum]|uniref:Uncharacterized protein n=1 Tax=Prorocentrum cordatum TaxID=2364126 RepID=A0ABN9PSY3_9DINO|nr:unnamed protein product [Polarella glacialis]